MQQEIESYLKRTEKKQLATYEDIRKKYLGDLTAHIELKVSEIREISSFVFNFVFFCLQKIF